MSSRVAIVGFVVAAVLFAAVGIVAITIDRATIGVSSLLVAIVFAFLSLLFWRRQRSSS
jgi:EamA domain-containing membrane protein RarD